MRNHLSCDLGKAGHAPLDVEEAVLVETPHVSGLEPSIDDDLVGEVLAVQVTGKDVGPPKPDDAAFVKGTPFVGGGIRDPDRDAREEGPHRAEFAARDDGSPVIGCFSVGEIDIGGGGGLGQTVALEGEQAELLLK